MNRRLAQGSMRKSGYTVLETADPADRYSKVSQRPCPVWNA